MIKKSIRETGKERRERLREYYTYNQTNYPMCPENLKEMKRGNEEKKGAD